MDMRIYVMTHKKIEAISDEMYIPLQVGGALHESFGYISDDTGDNISKKNAVYCELTGMYWLWKNIECDVVGVCHYRRYFIREGKLLDKSYIEHTIKRYAIMIPDSRCVNEEDVYTHYTKRHYAKDLDLCREIISEKYPKYLMAFDYAMETILVSIGNMWITRKDIFDRYCKWLFDILFELEKRMNILDYDDYQKRVMGFLAERLFRVWLFLQPEAITEEEMKMAGPSDFLCVKKREKLLYRYMQLKMEPVFRLCQLESARESDLQQSFCRDDFQEKIPVWVCWWQGVDDMPECIRCCIESIKKNFSSDRTKILLITFENCLNYVTFSDPIIHKFQEGKLSDSNLLHILMAELLFRYGGIWINADYYMTRPVKSEIFKHQMYTWSPDLWYVQKGMQLFWIVFKSLCYYWETEDKWPDSLSVEHIIASAAEAIPEIAYEWNACGHGEDEVSDFSQWMERKYSSEKAKKWMMENTFYKIDCCEHYRIENMAGEKTVYGELFA